MEPFILIAVSVVSTALVITPLALWTGLRLGKGIGRCSTLQGIDDHLYYKGVGKVIFLRFRKYAIRGQIVPAESAVIPQ